ncbi:hypothetical protein GCM10025768_26960 [Microbacterium pseudoresistens]
MAGDTRIDVRDTPKPQRHALILEAFDRLAAGDSILLTNDHEPRHLREDFERELPGSFGWESLGPDEDGSWQVRITKTTRAPLPRLVADTNALFADLDPSSAGSVWQLTPARRDLDANIIALPAGDAIDTHDGPGLDVLFVVLSGSGTLGTETGEIALAPGAVVWLPPRSQRRIDAGAEGLRYLTVHHRKPTLSITPRP